MFSVLRCTPFSFYGSFKIMFHALRNWRWQSRTSSICRSGVGIKVLDTDLTMINSMGRLQGQTGSIVIVVFPIDPGISLQRVPKQSKSRAVFETGITSNSTEMTMNVMLCDSN